MWLQLWRKIELCDRRQKSYWNEEQATQYMARVIIYYPKKQIISYLGHVHHSHGLLQAPKKLSILSLSL